MRPSLRLFVRSTPPRLSHTQPQPQPQAPAQPPIKRPSWSSTLRLPKSTLPPRPNPSDTPKYLHQSTDELYAWQQRHRPPENTFTLHDGPPYANGPLHVGHALNKITKDILLRFQLSQGKRIHYVPGWDCHGLPIEVKALQGLGDARQNLTPMAIRSAAAALAAATVDEQMKGFRRWAVLGEWKNAYRTMEKGFELRQLGVFKEMVERGLIYRQFKPVYWSPSSRSALAEAELEYDDNHVSLAAYVKFPLVKLPERLAARLGDTAIQSLSALIWTTTPWTLPANRAIAVHDELEYCIVRLLDSGDSMLVASSRLEYVMHVANHHLDAYEIVVEGIHGADLVGSVYTNPIGSDLTFPVIHAPYVSATTGSGLVHTAPGHGFDDYNLCKTLGIEAFAPLDDAGCFTEAAFPGNPSALAGKNVVKDGSQAVLQLLESNGSNSVFHSHKQVHKYPIDWRTKQPVIMRATAQWFADVASIKGDALQSLENVNFLPDAGRTRMINFINGRSEWCISRQRAWGVPIPALFRVEKSLHGSQEAVMTGESVQHIMSTVEERGIDAWWTDPPNDPAWILPSLRSSGSFVRGTDTMDVWFDSGTSWTLLDRPKDATKPLADVYLEGTDQHRGWFQSSLLTYVAHQMAVSSSTKGHGDPIKAPYKTLITHGFTLDEQGHKMSKSLGNVISPDEIMEGTLLPPVKQKRGNKNKSSAPNAKASTLPTYDALGADALRLWVASADYTRDVIVGQPVLQAVNNSLHKYRVTFKWLLGVLSDFSLPSSPSAITNTFQLLQHPPFILSYADRLAYLHLSQTSRAVHAAYSAHEPYKAMARLSKYIAHDLSAFYIETTKDPLYAGLPSEYLPTQATCLLILRELLAMLNPVAPLLVTETATHASPALRETLARLASPGAEALQGGEGYNPLQHIWTPLPLPHDASSLEQEWSIFAPLHSAVKNALEQARAAKRMGSSLEADVTVSIVSPSAESSPPATSSVNPTAFLHNLNPETAAAMLVVSGFEVVDHDHTSEESDNGSDWSFTCDSMPVADGSVFRVVVRPAAAGKCPRCWRFAVPRDVLDNVSDSGRDANEERVCGRCTEVLDLQSSGTTNA